MLRVCCSSPSSTTKFTLPQKPCLTTACKKFRTGLKTSCGASSSVGIATDYGLDGPRIESRWGGGVASFPPGQTGPGAHPAFCTKGTGSLPGVKCGRGVLLTTHPLVAPRSWKSRAITLPPSGPQPGL
jgi:hypothetical protein